MNDVRRAEAAPTVGLVAALGTHTHDAAGRARAPVPTTQSGRLLAAKRRATRR
jgi:hypothetical protein